MESGILDCDDGVGLAWIRSAGRAPTVVFLPGFRSDMQGSKATALHAACMEDGQAMLRLDYSGHGASGGRFEQGTIGRWRDDALAIIDRVTNGPLLLVGSSMGGWIALLLALARPDRVMGLVGIAAAPDFTEDLMWGAMTPVERAALEHNGVLLVPSEYGEPLAVTRGLIDEGRTNLLLRAPIKLGCPVRLLQGQRDPDVPWETALKLADRLETPNVRTILVKDGDHRLSRPQDLDVLIATVRDLLRQDGA
jgi:pimeloyl-ACP methyl ester carboxylesterase